MNDRNAQSNKLEAVIKDHIVSSISVKEAMVQDTTHLALIKEASYLVMGAFQNGSKVMLAGNGGSAADAQHIAGEFVSKFEFDRPGLPAIALTTDTSIITAIGNDYGYERLFSRQVQAHGCKGDVFVGISTSGNSANIVKALEWCRANDVKTIGLTGSGDNEMKKLCDMCIQVPSTHTPRIQEAHILIGHVICAIVEDELFSEKYQK